jgi:ABC-type transport system involved in cytochrome bd biosynthesis fused ATPase/permease subunit
VITALTGLAFSFFDGLTALVLAGSMLFGAAVLPFVTGLIGRTSGAEVIAARTRINTHLVDSIQGLAESVVFGYDRQRSIELGHVNGELASKERHMARLDGLQMGLSTLLVNLASAAVLFTALDRVDGVYLATLTLGTVAAFEAITPLALAAQNLGKEMTAAHRVFEIIDDEPVIKPPLKPQTPPAEDWMLKLENVSFRYDPAEPCIFDDFSLSIPYGEKLAVMGPSGAGKSSLVNLLLRFWEYEAGQITVGGVDLRTLEHKDIRQTFGVMTQRTHLFNTTVSENIRIARSTATDAEIVQAAQAAQVHDFIMSLPDGYATFVGENGVALSGGERQRIAMARVILKDAPIWLLDEFTANLDPVTASALLRSVLDTARSRTVISITHRAALVTQGAFGRVIKLPY